ncbi:D-lactate dehydrogenase-like protein [Leptomonas seymouri]|uniref:D-lactate dehydrogenase (cytochrome) n=1 Tax=Leptomonas seymouri TaxID=5684 RepID=A0A0N1PE88_LEPSE|nr:D-lactate dehydrogenase-like protein [Leptomonas seymouri]|eukprot:KPI89933.1 D-lactate dehydrogenase-like protein [Leptomonas seymouri]
MPSAKRSAPASGAYNVGTFEERQKKYALCIEEIRKVLRNPDKQLELRKEKLVYYSKDHSHHLHVLPAAAVTPTTVEEVAAIVKICNGLRVPMTPRGAGTGVEGGAIPYAGGIVIDTNGLTRMDFDEENACVWVGAGVKKLTLNEECAKRGLLLGPDPASNPCVGGMVSTSGSGMSTLRYGTTRENVISLKVVTPTGDVMLTRQVVRKSSSGLELTQLYIGSEGTLGVVCEVCFRLFPLTKYSAGGYAAFKTTGDAVRAVVALRQRGFPPTLLRCELMNEHNIDSTNKYCKMSLPVTATILLEFTSNDLELRDIKGDYNTVEKIFKEVGHAEVVRYLRPGKEMDDVWNARRQCYFATMFCRGKAEKVFGTDICVPISKLTEMVEYTEDVFKRARKKCFICAHISDGNFHTNIPFTGRQELQELHQLETKMINKAIELGGTVSGEHGIGVGKVHLVAGEHGQGHIDVQEAIKKALDRHNVMNPGAFYPSQQQLYPTAHL